MPEIRYKNIGVHYESTGQGGAVVLLHGFLEDLTMWNSISSELSIDHHVIRIDLLGHGATENLGYIHDMEEQARMVKAVLNELKIKNYTVIGHSMGGYVALALAEMHPEEINGLCLMNSTSLADSMDKRTNRDRAIQAVKKNHRSFVRIAIPGLFAPGNRDRFASEIAEATRISLAMSPQGIIGALVGMKIRKDRSNIFRRGEFQKLLVIGEQDPALDQDSLLPQTRYPGVKTVLFKDGHMSHIENQKELTKTLLEFLKQVNEQSNGS